MLREKRARCYQWNTAVDLGETAGFVQTGCMCFASSYRISKPKKPQSAGKLLCPRLLALLQAKERGTEKCEFKPAEIFAVSPVPVPSPLHLSLLLGRVTCYAGHILRPKMPQSHAQGAPSNVRCAQQCGKTLCSPQHPLGWGWDAPQQIKPQPTPQTPHAVQV